MLGILGGTSFLGTDAFRGGQERTVQTESGDAILFAADSALFLPRHGIEGKVPPHRINHQAHLRALVKSGADRLVCFGSVGSLQVGYPPGTLQVIDDTFAPFRVMTLHDDRMLYTVPGFDPTWRRQVIHRLESAGLNPTDGGVYAETLGPRFETPAEIRWLAGVADVVGMTCASEAALAREFNLPVAVVTMVDNYANGIGTEPLTGDAFREQVKKNETKVLRALAAILEGEW